MKSPYDGIINHPHHVSRNHHRMPMHGRAAQFPPFTALTGCEDAVRETAGLTDPRRELDDQESAELNRRLSFPASKLDEHPEVAIEYFVPEDRRIVCHVYRSGGKNLLRGTNNRHVRWTGDPDCRCSAAGWRNF